MLNLKESQLNFSDNPYLPVNTSNRFNFYTLDRYINDVKTIGLQNTWKSICKFIEQNYPNIPDFLNIENFGELYEIGLSIEDKTLKKECGQYYTPDDISKIMCEWLTQYNGENICDVGCGTGKLILKYLHILNKEEAKKIISSGKIYLYDNDETALNICKTAIGALYGYNISNKLNTIHCDFLNKSVTLPENSKVISNPPYAKIKQISDYWEKSEVISDTKEYYAAFMEKIFKQSSSAVIITPFSFISGNKFYSLRTTMSNHSGFIVSFDNVPGNIFSGKKHGIFNSNTANSVRAAITVFNKSKKRKGFRLTPLIRFKQTERTKLIKCSILEKFLNPEKQIINAKNTMFFKCHKQLNKIFSVWNEKSNGKVLSDYTSENGTYTIAIPNTCRYYTTASDKKMNRSGQIILNFNDKNIFNFVYCMINSSFAYWHWRIYDGGITYPKNLLLNMPIFYELLTEDDHNFFNTLTQEMISCSDKFIIRKNNIGTQEESTEIKKIKDYSKYYLLMKMKKYLI